MGESEVLSLPAPCKSMAATSSTAGDLQEVLQVKPTTLITGQTVHGSVHFGRRHAQGADATSEEGFLFCLEDESLKTYTAFVPWTTAFLDLQLSNTGIQSMSENQRHLAETLIKMTRLETDPSDTRKLVLAFEKLQPTKKLLKNVDVRGHKALKGVGHSRRINPPRLALPPAEEKASTAPPPASVRGDCWSIVLEQKANLGKQPFIVKIYRAVEIEFLLIIAHSEVNGSDYELGLDGDRAKSLGLRLGSESGLTAWSDVVSRLTLKKDRRRGMQLLLAERQQHERTVQSTEIFSREKTFGALRCLISMFEAAGHLRVEVRPVVT
jgi:hypothetical protein